MVTIPSCAVIEINNDELITIPNFNLQFKSLDHENPYFKTSYRKQDSSLRYVKTGAHYTFQISLVSIIPETSYFTRRHHLHSQHHVSPYINVII